MTKTVLRRAAVVEPNQHKRKLILLLFIALTKSHSLASASSIYNLIHVVLCSRCDSDVVNEAKEQLSSLLMGENEAMLLQDYDDDQQRDTNDRNDDDDWGPDDVRTLKQQSPFTDFLQFHDNSG